MRVAFSGTHRTGKTTLLEAISAELPAYTTIDEPYRLLEDEGYELSDPPTAEDFERQLRRSFQAIAESGANTLFDRCPLDLLAYLQVIDDELDADAWLDELRTSIEALDLIVVVSIESPDVIVVPAHEDRRLRSRVDEVVRTLVLDDPHGFGTPTLEVTGTVDARVQQVLRALTTA
jgi:predicted ATPase